MKNRSGITGVEVFDENRVCSGTWNYWSCQRQNRNWVTLSTSGKLDRNPYSDKRRFHGTILSELNRRKKISKILFVKSRKYRFKRPLTYIKSGFCYISFDSIDDELLKHLVIARISQPHVNQLLVSRLNPILKMLWNRTRYAAYLGKFL
jgi:hypothetical protein